MLGGLAGAWGFAFAFASLGCDDWLTGKIGMNVVGKTRRGEEWRGRGVLCEQSRGYRGYYVYDLRGYVVCHE